MGILLGLNYSEHAEAAYNEFPQFTVSSFEFSLYAGVHGVTGDIR